MRTSEREIAVRGFINERFGKTYGKNLFHRALINGSVELRDPYSKYLIDLFEYDAWIHTARTDKQMETVRWLEGFDLRNEPDLMASWIQHYEPFTKSKTPVDGVCVYAPDTGEIYIKIEDAVSGSAWDWQLTAIPCKNWGPKKPAFIASNTDLNNW